MYLTLNRTKQDKVNSLLGYVFFMVDYINLAKKNMIFDLISDDIAHIIFSLDLRSLCGQKRGGEERGDFDAFRFFQNLYSPSFSRFNNAPQRDYIGT